MDLWCDVMWERLRATPSFDTPGPPNTHTHTHTKAAKRKAAKDLWKNSFNFQKERSVLSWLEMVFPLALRMSSFCSPLAFLTDHVHKTWARNILFGSLVIQKICVIFSGKLFYFLGSNSIPLIFSPYYHSKIKPMVQNWTNWLLDQWTTFRGGLLKSLSHWAKQEVDHQWTVCRVIVFGPWKQLLCVSPSDDFCASFLHPRSGQDVTSWSYLHTQSWHITLTCLTVALPRHCPT